MGDGRGVTTTTAAAGSLRGAEPGVELRDGAVRVEVAPVEAAAGFVLRELGGARVLFAAGWGDWKGWGGRSNG